MKKLFLYGSLSFLCLNIYAQNELDALRYCTLGGGGTARSLGMGGAFSAIGADASAAMINPAGIAVFRRGEFNFGFQFVNTSNNSTYIDQSFKQDRLNFNIPSLNLIIANVKYDETGKPAKRGLVNINYGLNINRLANFNNHIVFDAVNQKSSIADFFADRANQDFASKGSFDQGSIPDLAFLSGAIWDTGGVYTPYYRGVNRNERNVEQNGDLSQKGSMYEYQATIGANIGHKIQIGLGLFYSSLRYDEELSITETDNRAHTGMYTPDMATLDYQYKMYDRGNAVGARFGLIVRPTDQLRLGFSIQTPRTFTINEEYGYSIEVTGDPGAPSAPPKAYNDPLSTYTYKVITPARLNAGLGFVIQKIAILSADFEFYDYSQANLNAKDYAFNRENSNIRKNYSNVVNLRLGVEFNVPNPDNKDQSYRYRLGYANSPSPFSAKAAGLDEVLKKAGNLICTGFGFRDKDYYLDFSLTFGSASNYYTPYTVSNSAYPYYSVVNQQNRVAFSFSLGLNFD
jgi:hypothetical protein